MDIQQVRANRHEVVDGDGRTRTVVEYEPSDAQTLNHAGQTYETQGNGVFRVPDELGRQLVGGLFRDVTATRGKSVVLTHLPPGEPPVLQAAERPAAEGEQGVNAASAVPPAEVASKRPSPAKKAVVAKKAAAKK